MIDIAQIQAARGLLGWRISDLAEKTEIQSNTISILEREKTQPRRETLERIQHAFEDAGIEFLPNSGLRKKDQVVLIHEGDEAQSKLREDIYETLAQTGGEVLIAHVDESKAVDSGAQQIIADHLQRLKEANITERLLVREGDTNFIAPKEFYHVMPENYFSAYPLYIYGSKIALASRNPSPKVVIVNDARFADSVKRLFNFVWDQTKEVKD